MRDIPFAELTAGRWPGILAALGIPSRALNHRNGPCPACGGRDRFRFIDSGGKGTWICSQCMPKGGNGAALVMAKHGVDFPTAAAMIEDVAPRAPEIARKAEKSASELRADRIALWHRGVRLTRDCPGGVYLAARRCYQDLDPSFVRWLPVPDRGFGAILCKIIGPAGAPASLHRTLLTADGIRAPIAKAKLYMKGECPPGNWTPLRAEGPHIAVAEGLETALSAWTIFGEPVSPCHVAGNLQAWHPPESCLSVTIYADNDRNWTGQRAAAVLANRLLTLQSPDGSPRYQVTVRWPENEGDDWNDVLMRSPARSTAPR
jgi:putative DNA primase/helicase